MPNWCEVDCQINFPDETEKKKLQAALDAEIAKAKAEDKGLFVGCKEKYLFFLDRRVISIIRVIFRFITFLIQKNSMMLSFWKNGSM